MEYDAQNSIINTCWIWPGMKDWRGYALTPRMQRLATRRKRLHTLVWEIANGKRVPEGFELDHRCKEKSCINPFHLEPVTHAENVHRGARSKATPEVVAAIRSEYRRGVSGHGQWELAEKYGLGRSTVQKIVNGWTWR
jgi:hypothetical protein